jgi:hypothetical protein
VQVLDVGSLADAAPAVGEGIGPEAAGWSDDLGTADVLRRPRVLERAVWDNGRPVARPIVVDVEASLEADQ